MIEIISKWILNRLGWVVDMNLDTFRVKTTNGRLISQLLLSYDVITIEELNLLRKSDHVNDCYDNFELINNWLSRLHLTLPEEDVYEIVHGVGSVSLDLFYRVFLELKDKTKLHFLTDNELNAQLGTRSHRFNVNIIADDDDPNKLNLQREGLCQPFLDGGDVYRWHKDRLETMTQRTKEARDEYIHNAKIQIKSSSGIYKKIHSDRAMVFHRGLSIFFNRPTCEDVDDLEDASKTYEELIALQKEAESMQKFVPSSKEANNILGNVQAKIKLRQKNKRLGTQWHQAIMSQFDRKTENSKAKCEDRVITDAFMKQSLYEKELVTKLGQVKLEIEYIKENRLKQCHLLNKLKENDFVDALMLKEKEINEQKLMYFLERGRLLELHQKIGNEKAQINQSKNQQLCKKALKDIVDISIKIFEYKKRYSQEPDKREMENLKNLFVSGQSIFEICVPIIDIIKNNDYDIPEDIIADETTRQNAIDQEEFEKYGKYEWPWEVKNLPEFSVELIEQISSGLDVLGYIVHRALEHKYPIVPLWEKAYFPNISTRVCINGLNDTTILPSLRKLLKHKHIKVIELNDAVDYCLAAYRQESNKKGDQEKNDELLTKEQKSIKIQAKLKKGEKSISIKKPAEEIVISASTNPMETTLNKKIQTPEIYPCEAIAYTHSAELGRTVQDLLDQGKPIGDFLLIDMFLEYLRSVPSLEGWVLVNYPINLDQALLIEEALTGVKLGPTTNDMSSSSELDAKRHSKFLSNPIKPKPLQIYETSLTAFIRLKKLSVDDETCDAILPPIHEQLAISNLDPLDKFYSDAGANYSMHYKELDWGAIEYLAKLIIGDFSLPLKASSELFGDAARLDEQPTKSIKGTKVGRKLKKPQPKLELETTDEVPSTKVIVDKKSKKGKTKIVIVFADKSVQVPTDDEEEEEEEEWNKASELNVNLPETEPSGYEYSQSDCPSELLMSLATIWETVEEIYTNDLKQVFFLIRLNLDAVMPFAQFVKDCMRKIIERPDEKTMILSKFQNAFNAFDMDFRTDDEFKVEMYCRIEDFKEKLSEMSEIKMAESENMRCRIICADWAPRQLNELVNNYVAVLQIELERYIESVHFINDYYMGIISGSPSDDDMYKEDPTPKFKGIDADYINKMFLDSSSPIEITEFEELLSNVTQKLHNSVKKISATVTNCIEKPKTGLSTGSGKQAKSKSGSQKSKGTKNTKKLLESNLAPLKDDVNKLKEEWQRAANGETRRIKLQIDLIENTALESIREFLTNIQNSYDDVYNAILTKYANEMENINKVCDIFKAAVENEAALQKEFSFDGHSLQINPEVNLYDNVPLIPKLDQESIAGGFSIEQLSKLSDIFLDLSPNGYIAKANFIFLLQDALSVENSLMPKLWQKLAEASMLKKVVEALFDDLEYVYWKDFIIYSIRIPFPSELDIYVTRKAFRECDPDSTELIQDYQLYSTNLWFEERHSSKRNISIKKLLFKLYHIENLGFNYTAMLLDFCKDENAVQGFAKALGLSLGKIVCWDFDIGNAFRDEYLATMQQQENEATNREAERDLLYKTTREEIDKLIDKIINNDSEVVIDLKNKSQSSLDSKSRRGSCMKKNRDSSKAEELRCNKSVEFAEVEVQSLSTIEEISESKPENCSNSDTDDDSQVIDLFTEVPSDNNERSNSAETAEIIFFLPLEEVLTVLSVSIPWHVRLLTIGDLSVCEKAEEIYEKCRNPDFDMWVLSHEYLNNEMFLDLLNLTKKFCAIDPVVVVSDVLNENI